MTTALIVLLAVGLLVWLSCARPSFSSAPADRDRTRQLDELRALAGSRADVSVSPRTRR
jgi:hypothetical protein